MSRLSLLTVFLALVCNAPAWADKIDCKDSRLQVFPGADCSQNDASAAWGSKSGAAARMSSKDYHAQGAHEGVTYHVLYHKGESPQQFVKPSTEKSQSNSIKSFDEVTKAGKKWSKPERAGSARYRTFNRDKAPCFGFYQFGAAKGGGHESVTKGYFCRDKGKPFDGASVSAILAEIKTR